MPYSEGRFYVWATSNQKSIRDPKKKAIKYTFVDIWHWGAGTWMGRPLTAGKAAVQTGGGARQLKFACAAQAHRLGNKSTVLVVDSEGVYLARLILHLLSLP